MRYHPASYLICPLVAYGSEQEHAVMLDLVIRNAKIHDGTGSPWFRADVGVMGSRISVIGRVSAKSRSTIAGRGLALCPGFIDVHTHSDGIVERPSAGNVLRQGVTTVVSGNCGGSKLPIGPWLDKVEAARPAINYATLVGHGSIRTKVLGSAQRKATKPELARMRRFAERAMREGAVGLSTGLFYVPGSYADVDEIVEVSKAAGDAGGVYATHARSAGGGVFDAFEEAATVGKRAGVPVQVSHLKVLHRRGHTGRDRAEEVIAAVGRYRDSGIDLTYDSYPYGASCTSLSAVTVPPWVSKDGKLIERLQDTAIRRQIRDDVIGKIAWMGGADKIVIIHFKPDKSLEGRSLDQVARIRKQNVFTVAMDLIVEGSPSCIFHSFRAGDVDKFICSPYCMIASDGGVVLSRKSPVHPRHYGTFPRVLGDYVRDRKLLSLEDAVRKMTSLPARRFGLIGRGLIAVGMKADLVLFDPKTVGDAASFDECHVFPDGIKRVIVNGQIAWNGRSVSKQRAGEVIRNQ